MAEKSPLRRKYARVPVQRAKRFGPDFWVYAFLGFALFWMTKPLVTFITGADPDAPPTKFSQANYTVAFLQSGIFLVTLLILARNFRKLGPFLTKAWPFVLFFLYEAGTILLSWDSKWSFYAFLQYTYGISVILAIATCLPSIRITRVIIIIIWFCCVLSLLFVVAIPKYGIMGHNPLAGEDSGGGQAWRGIYPHKNYLGHLAAVALVCLWAFGRKYMKPVWLWPIGLVASLLCLVFAKCAGAYLVATLLLMMYYMVFRQRGMIRSLGLFVVIIVGAISALLKQTLTASILKALGKNENLTGRTEIWAYASPYMHARPTIGLGYNFTAAPAFTSDFIAKFNNTNVHNAYIDLLINLGIVGVVLFGLVVVLALFAAWRQPMTGEADDLRCICSMALLACLICGMSEVLITQPLGPQSILLMLSLFGLFRVSLDAAPAQAPSLRPKRRRSTAAVAAAP